MSRAKSGRLPLDVCLCTFVESAISQDHPMAAEALTILRASGGHGVGLDILAEGAATAALGALEGIGYAPTSKDTLEALTGASGAIAETRRVLIRDTIVNDDAYLSAKREVDHLSWRDEPLERVKADFAGAFAALRARRDLLQSAEGARDCARSAFGFARMVTECTDPDHVEHWQRQSARSAGSAFWFAMQSAPEVTTAALREVLESVPQLGG